MRALILFVLVLVAIDPALAQRTRYVTDQLKLEVRSGPGVQNRIVRMLESGTPVTVLDGSEGWSRVRYGDDGEGWILDRFLMAEPPARGRLESATDSMKAAREEVVRLQEELNKINQANAELTESRDAFVNKTSNLTNELADIKRTAASAIAVRNENQQLKQQSLSLSQQLEDLKREYTVLRDGRNRDWFIAGAGVLFGGMLLGLIIPRIRWKRRRSWSEL